MNKSIKTHLTTQSVALALLIATACMSASHAQTSSANPVIGTWSWTLFSGKCTETLQFRLDGALLSTSGEAVTESRYAISSTPDTQGFFKVDEIYTRYNAKKDCSGDVIDEIGVETTRYIQINPAKDRLIICKTASFLACYGPLRRLP